MLTRGEESPLRPARNTPNASQEALGLLSCKGILLAHGQPVHQGPQYILVYGFIPPQGQDFSFPFVELDDIHVGPFLQHVTVPLNGSATLWPINQSFQFCIISIEGALRPIIQVTNEDVNSSGPGICSWGTSLVTSRQLDFMPLITTLQTQQSTSLSYLSAL